MMESLPNRPLAMPEADELAYSDTDVTPCSILYDRDGEAPPVVTALLAIVDGEGIMVGFHPSTGSWEVVENFGDEYSKEEWDRKATEWQEEEYEMAQNEIWEIDPEGDNVE